MAVALATRVRARQFCHEALGVLLLSMGGHRTHRCGQGVQHGPRLPGM